MMLSSVREKQQNQYPCGARELSLRVVVGLEKNMMTSSNGNNFRVTGPLCGEFTGPGEFPTQRPVTRSFDVFFDVRLNHVTSHHTTSHYIITSYHIIASSHHHIITSPHHHHHHHTTQHHITLSHLINSSHHITSHITSSHE